MGYVTQRGALAPFHFMVGGYLVVLLWLSDRRRDRLTIKTRVLTFRRESEILGSLRITHSRNQSSPKPIIYVDIWIYNFSQP